MKQAPTVIQCRLTNLRVFMVLAAMAAAWWAGYLLGEVW